MAKYSRVAEIFQNLREGKAMMKKYTVLMITPDYLAEQYGEDTYCAYVEAENVVEAQRAGQHEALAAVTPDEISPYPPEDFFVVFVCEGHVEDIKIW
jgi:hypothetical protein